MPAGCLPECSHLSSVVQLQGKLNLPRIVRSKASRSDFAEVGAGEVGRVWNGHDAVAAESGSIESRMVEDVEEFRPELHGNAFPDRDLLER